MVKVIEDIKLEGVASAHVTASFDKGKEALEKGEYKIISLEEYAKLRIQEGKDAFISRGGGLVREGVLYVPKKGIFLTKKSPIIDYAEEATNCHRKGKDFYLTDNQVEKALSDSVKLTKKEIPTNRFNDEEITVYVFGNIAKQYGEFIIEAGAHYGETQRKAGFGFGDSLRNLGTEKMPIWLADIQDKPFVKPIFVWGLNGFELEPWFRSFGYRSDLDGKTGNLAYIYNCIRGICGESVEGNTKTLEDKV